DRKGAGGGKGGKSGGARFFKKKKKKIYDTTCNVPPWRLARDAGQDRRDARATGTDPERDAARLSGKKDVLFFVIFFQAEDGIRDWSVTGVQTCALPISHRFHALGSPHQAYAAGKRRNRS